MTTQIVSTPIFISFSTDSSMMLKSPSLRQPLGLLSACVPSRKPWPAARITASLVIQIIKVFDKQVA